jgi:hypothetical protein
MSNNVSLKNYLPFLALDPTIFDNVMPKPVTGKKCLLPDCNKETRHNGGYCCAGHCLEHRQMLKGK